MYAPFNPGHAGRVSRLRRWWRTCAPALRLVVVNAAVFLIVKIAMLTIYYSVPGPGAMAASQTPLAWLGLPGGLDGLLLKPWTAVSYMFTHHDVWHLLINMLWLYMFAGLLMMTCTGRQLTGLYLMGGVGGALLFEIAAVLWPATAVFGLEGSSAAVIAVVVAVMVMMPGMRLRLMLVGDVKVVWIGVVTLVLLGYNGMGNVAVQAAHLGGALTGLLFACMMRRGRDITAPVNHMCDLIVNFIEGLSHRSHSGRRPAEPRADIKSILDKVKTSGYASLTPDERARLFGHRK